MAHTKNVRESGAYHQYEEAPPFEPEPGFSLEFVYGMIFKVYFRERWMRNPEEDLIGNSIAIERDLFTNDINY